MDTTRASLLFRVKDLRDAAAWAEFDSIYRPLLERFARRCGLRDAEVEDLVQQCMAAIQQHIGGFEYDASKGRFKGWLRTMLNNRVRNLRRGRHDRPAETGELTALPTREPEPDEVFDKLWMEEHLRHCLRQIRSEVDETTFSAFRRYVLEEQPVKAVCTDLGLTAAQLYKIKWRLTRRLGELLKDLLGTEE